MKKIFKLTTIIISILALNSCGTIKEGFSSQKKNSIDEFLVEKKSPLVIIHTNIYIYIYICMHPCIRTY